MLLLLQQHRLDVKWAMSSSSVTSKLVKIQHQGQRHYGLRQSLMPRPSTLHDLWTEWTIGTGGRRPESSFNAHERGSVKSVYSFHKPFWDKVEEMVRVGMSAQVVCDVIHRAYGQQTPITSILRNLRQDSKSGNWPAALCNAHL